MKTRLLWFVTLSLLANQVFSQDSASQASLETPEATVHFIHEKKLSDQDRTVKLGFLFNLKPKWHIYWQNPGDSGLPPKAEWLDTPGWTFSSFSWPTPSRINLNVLANYGYENEVLLPLTATRASKGDEVIKVKLSWLVCKEECIPREGILRLDLRSKPTFKVAFDVQSPIHLDGWAWSTLSQSETSLRGVLQLPIAYEKLSNAAIDFFPYEEGQLKAYPAPSFSVQPQGAKTSLIEMVFQKKRKKLPALTELPGILKVGSESYDIAASAETLKDRPTIESTPNKPTEKLSLWVIFAAFLGGILLNLMPCVFPVLAIKIFDFSSKKTDSRRELKIQSYLYALGILVCFWILAGVVFALRAQGHLVGWGFQLQSSFFVVFLATLFMCLTLNFWGFFEIHLPVNKYLPVKSTEGRLGAFFSGLLTTLISTPCTAPFLGVALGAALTLSIFESILIFSMMGLGVAFPYVLLMHWSYLRDKMPKPGPWMVQFKEALGFLLLGTVIWLLWVLGRQNQMTSMVWAMTGFVFLSFAMWWKGFFKTWIKLGAGLLSLTCLSWASMDHRQISSDWKKYNAVEVQAAAQSQMVFIDFTASWCLTCQVNKAVALDQPAVKEVFKKNNVALFRGDWTSQDPDITQALMSYGRSSVPTNVLLSPKDPKGYVFPPILTPSMLIAEINKRSNVE